MAELIALFSPMWEYTFTIGTAEVSAGLVAFGSLLGGTAVGLIKKVGGRR